MADSTLFQSFPLSDWPWGGDTGNLYIFDDIQWTDQNGVVRLANKDKDVNGPRQRCPILVDVRVPVVQAFYFQPTVLSIDRPRATRTGVVYDSDDGEHYTLFQGAVFCNRPDPMTWTDFTALIHATCRTRMQDRYLTETVIRALFDGIDFVTAGDLARLPTARGTAVIVDGSVVVPSALVTLTSMINAFSMSAGVSGNLRAERESYNAGADFTIISTNELDNGTVGWEITEPF